MLSSLTLALLGAVPAMAAVHEQLAAVPSGWTATSLPDSETAISFSLGLAQQNIDQLEAKLLAVSTPGNAEFGQHLDVDDVNAMFAPSSTAVDAVQSWLQGAGATTAVTPDGHWITFTTTVGQANTLLNTTFKSYSNAGVSKIRTTEYSVPDALAQYVDLIAPTVFFGKTAAMMPAFMKAAPTKVEAVEAPSKRDVAPSCQTSITPQCLQAMYNTVGYTPDPSSGSRVAFGSFLNQSANHQDLAAYEKLYNIPSQDFTVEIINGGIDDQNLATAQIGEADLDVQNIVGIAHPLPVTEYITGGLAPFIPNIDEPANEGSNEPYIPYYQYLLSKPNCDLPQVISNSYGDEEDTVPFKYAVRVCNMIGMMGLRGITILESSGDIGIGAGCVANDGKNTTRFNPTFPGSCPYVLSIGGTQAVTPEVAWDSSSGGFSDYFKQPSYQTKAVQTYLKKYITPATKKYYKPYVDFTGRGFPDISAHSLTPDYNVVYNLTQSPSGGTSAAAPVVAGILALLNDARFRAGKNSSLGFINPILYSIGASSLIDITAGSAVGCNGVNGQTGQPTGGAVIPFASWNATIGWDPVTGLGTPDFQKLKSLFLSL